MSDFPHTRWLECQSLLEDQGKRWRPGQPVRVEDYLAQHPSLRDDRAALLELIWHEAALRPARGEKPDPEEYCRRFPHLADAIREHLAAISHSGSKPPSPATVAHATKPAALAEVA